MAYKRTMKKPNWGRCGTCNRPILTRRIKGTKEVVFLCKEPVYIILNPLSKSVYWYEGSWVRGDEHPNGIKAYRKHRCVFPKRV